MTTAAVSLAGVRVERGGRPVLHGVTGELRSGEIIGVFGPSGSGKSTLIRAIAGIQAGVTGAVSVLGREPGSAAMRRELGYMAQDPAVYEDMSVVENLRYFAALRAAEVGAVIDQVGLGGEQRRLVRTLSGGQRARVSLATALVGCPRLLLLDEPTVGLDPLLRRELWRLFRELAQSGATLVVSSHVMDEARHCDRLLLLRDGCLLAQLTPQELATSTGTTDLDEAFIRLIERMR